MINDDDDDDNLLNLSLLLSSCRWFSSILLWASVLDPLPRPSSKTSTIIDDVARCNQHDHSSPCFSFAGGCGVVGVSAFGPPTSAFGCGIAHHHSSSAGTWHVLQYSSTAFTIHQRTGPTCGPKRRDSSGLPHVVGLGPRGLWCFRDPLHTIHSTAYAEGYVSVLHAAALS